ncbi:MAG TPA: ABC transporter substrate-binding protein [Aggregatilineaceae bacterium]|nr:ABC transporter substrate-binding protein [Aggregatilineaceae bacterium]
MRKLHWLTLFVLVALVLTSAHAATANARRSTYLTLMGWSSSTEENNALQNMVNEFMKANPDIVVNLNLVPAFDTTIQAAFASGDPPNVFYVDSSKLPDWAEAGVLAVGGDKIVDKEDIYPSLLEVFTYKGQLYCPPKDFSTMTLQYNKDMFDAAGLAYPTPDWTWDDLKSAAEKLTGQTADGKKVLGLVTPPNFERWLPFLYQAGGSVLNDDWTASTFDSDQTRAALDLYVGLVTDGFAGPPSAVDAGWGGEAFGNGRVAMAMEGNWVITYLLNQFPDLHWGVTELPKGPAGQASMAFTVCYGVAAENKYPDESWTLVNYLTGKEGAQLVATQGFGVMPARISAADAWLTSMGQQFEPFVKSADYAHKWQFPVGFQDAIDTFNADLQNAFQGSATTDDIISDTNSVIEEVLSR